MAAVRPGPALGAKTLSRLDLKTEGSLLARRLASDMLYAPLVLALNSQSIPVARDIARRLGGEVDRIFVEGMASATGQASGAVSETGHVAMEGHGSGKSGSEEAFARDVLNHIIRLVERRVAATPGSALADPEGRNVILVADGLAGGATMVAAIRGVRSQNPRRLVAAVGVAPTRTLDRIRTEADETVALATVARIGDVGRVRRARRRAASVPLRATDEQPPAGAGAPLPPGKDRAVGGRVPVRSEGSTGAGGRSGT